MRLWVLKRRLAGLSVVFLIFLVIIGYAVYQLWPEQSCFNGVKDSGEVGIDCGGVCQKQCLIEDPKDPNLLWSRFFSVRTGVYDVGAMVENINLEAGARNVKYIFKLYNNEGILLARREGETWLYPEQKTFIYEPQLVTGEKQPSRVDFEILPFQWEPLTNKQPLEIDVVRKDFDTSLDPTVRITLANRSFFEEPGMEVVVLLEESNGNVFAASRTYIRNFESDSQRQALFSWPTARFDTPSNIQVLYRRTLE